MLVFPSGGLLLWWVRPFLADESLQFSLSDKGFYLLLQVVMFRRVVTVVMVETTVLVSGPFVGVFFQLARPCQGCLVLDLHQDLINRGCQQGEACEPPSEGLGTPILSSVSCPYYLPSLVLSYIFLPFPLFRLLFSGQQRILCVHVLSSSVKYI